MRQTTRMTCAAIVVIVILSLVRQGTGEDDNRRWTRAGIRAGGWDGWRKAVKTTRDETAEIACGLVDVGLDATRENEDRIAALLLAAETGDPAALTRMAENLPLKIPKMVRVGDDDKLKSMPCVYGLSQARWGAMPCVLDLLERKTPSDEEITLAVKVLRAVTSDDGLRAILRHESGRRGREFGRNAERVLSVLGG